MNLVHKVTIVVTFRRMCLQTKCHGENTSTWRFGSKRKHCEQSFNFVSLKVSLPSVAGATLAAEV